MSTPIIGKRIRLFVAAIAVFASTKYHAIDLGVVTGRIYSTMNANTAVQDDFYNMGTRWIRMEFEEFGGSYTPDTQYAKIVADCNARGINVLGLMTGNSCSDHFNPMWTEAYIANFYSALKWHIQRYPFVTHWDLLTKPASRGSMVRRSEDVLCSTLVTQHGVTFWVSTKPDRSITRILLPEEGGLDLEGL